jgi:hypothetical protein
MKKPRIAGIAHTVTNKALLGTRWRAALGAVTAIDTFVRIADRADDIGLRAARNLRRLGWLLQQLGAVPLRPEKPRPD